MNTDLENVKTLLGITDDEIHQQYFDKTKAASAELFKDEIERLDSQPHPYFHKDETIKKIILDAFETGWDCCQTMFLEIFNIQLKPEQAQTFVEGVVNEFKKLTDNVDNNE